MKEIILNLAGGTFRLSNGTIASNLHYGSVREFLDAGNDDAGDPLDNQFRYGRYEGAIDALESLILAAAQAEIDVQTEPFTTTLQTALDAIGSKLT